MAQNATDDDSMGPSQHELDLILNQDYMDAFRGKDYFSDHSTGHVFDVVEGNGIMRSNIGGDGLMKMIKVG